MPNKDDKILVPAKMQGGLAQMILMGMAMGGEQTQREIHEALNLPDRVQAYSHNIRAFQRREKISPAEYFISVGPGEIEGQYYACIMRPDDDPDSETGYKVVANGNRGFDTEDEAKMDAAKQFPSLPVLSGPDQYHYPFYDLSQMPAVAEAIALQERRAAKRQRDAKRTKEGQYKR